MKRKIRQLLSVGSVALVLSIGFTPAMGQDTSTGEVKKSGGEVKKAGKSMGRNVRRGRVVRGGKHFGKHMGRAGKHFGRSTKKVFKKVIS